MNHYIECECGCAAHTLRASIDPDPNYPCVYVEFFMGHFGFWRRLWIGIKYILGFKSKFGHFDEVVLSRCQVEQIRELCDKFLEFDNDQQPEDQRAGGRECRPQKEDKIC